MHTDERHIRWKSFIRYACLCCFLLILSLVLPFCPAMAQGGGVRIENISPDNVKTEPLHILTMTFRAINETDSAYELEAVVEMPLSWELVSPLFPFELDPGEEKPIFVAISVPLGAQAGDYKIFVEIASTGFVGFGDKAEVDVELIAVAKIEIEAPSDVFITAPGESYTRVFKVTNKSNAPSRFKAYVKSNKSWDMTFGPDEFTLEPGESKQISIASIIPEDITRDEMHRLTLVVEALDLTHGASIAKANTVTTIYPQLLSGDLYHSLPGTATLLTTWNDDNEMAGQITLDFDGELDNGHYGKLRIVEPYPTRWQGRRFMEEDSFSLEYGIENKGYLILGDNSFNITPLTERYYYGRGIDLLSETEEFTFRCFTADRRGGWLPGQLAGGQLSMQVEENTELTFTAFMKSEEIASSSTDDAYEREGRGVTLLCTTEPAEGVVLIGELGIGDMTNGEGRKSDEAYRISAEIQTETVTFDGELVHAGSNFPGYWQGSDSASAYTSFRISPDFNIWGSISKNRWDYWDDPLKPHPENIIQNIGANFNAGDFGRVSVYRRWSNRKDNNLFEWDEEEVTTNFQLSRQFDDFSLTGSTAFGEKRDNLDGSVNNIQRHQLMFSSQPWEGSVFSGGYRWDIEDSASGGEREKYEQIWLNADVNINDATKLTTRYTRNEGFNRPCIKWLRGELKHELDDENTLLLNAQWRGGDYGEELECALSMTFPLNLPLPWLPKNGRVEGIIHRADDEQTPLEGVIVSVGDMNVVTDSKGRFVFPGLVEGDYELLIDRGSIGLEYIPDVKIPQKFTSDLGKTIKLDIPVVKSASIRGRVLICKKVIGIVDPDAPPPSEGFPNASVFLIGDDETIVMTTDKHGRFTFRDIRPGLWSLKLVEGQIPEYHHAQPIEYVIEILPGERVTDIEFYITPVQRPILITVAGDE